VGVEVLIHAFFVLIVEGREWLVSRCNRFISTESTQCPLGRRKGWYVVAVRRTNFFT